MAILVIMFYFGALYLESKAQGEWMRSAQQGEVGEDNGQRIGHGGHHLDEDIQRDADNVLPGVAHGIAYDGAFVRLGALAVALEEAAF